eukprot:1157514-Pelagomonas_calceolata.AAC.7
MQAVAVLCFHPSFMHDRLRLGSDSLLQLQYKMLSKDGVKSGLQEFSLDIFNGGLCLHGQMDRQPLIPLLF